MSCNFLGRFIFTSNSILTVQFHWVETRRYDVVRLGFVEVSQVPPEVTWYSPPDPLRGPSSSFQVPLLRDHDTRCTGVIR